MEGNNVAVFGSSRTEPGDGDYAMAMESGRLLAEAGFGVVNGGYDGLMAAVSQGASAAGGRVIGVTVPDFFPGRTGANRFLTEEVRTGSLTERLHQMRLRTCAALVLPGSIGTFTELAVYWNDAYLAPLRQAKPPPVVALGGPWRSLVEHLENLLSVPAGLTLFADSPSQAVSIIRARIA